MRNKVMAQGKFSPMTTAQASMAKVTLPVYSEDQIATIKFMIEEEKLAGDLYEAFYAQNGLPIFQRIAASEDRHMQALVQQAQAAGLDVSDLLSLPAGQFANAELQSLYDQLLSVGSTSLEAALRVGQAVEQQDIADLTDTRVTLVGTPFERVYSQIESGSQHHLAAFEAYLAAW